MKNYNKPNVEVVKIAPLASIAAGGLENWLMGNEISAASNLSTYEYSSVQFER